MSIAKDRACMRKGVLCGHRRHGSMGIGSRICHYLLDTGEKRGCPAGRKCSHWTDEKCCMLDETKTIKE